MIGGVAAALVYDFLLYPKKESFGKRMKVLKGTADPDASATEPLIEPRTSRSGSGQWPRPWNLSLTFIKCLYIIKIYNIISLVVVVVQMIVVSASSSVLLCVPASFWLNWQLARLLPTLKEVFSVYNSGISCNSIQRTYRFILGEADYFCFTGWQLIE